MDKIIRAKTAKTEATDEAKRQFKAEAELTNDIRETDTIMRTYYIKTPNWLKLKSLSTRLAWEKGKKVNMNDLVNEALGLLFEKYEVKADELAGSAEQAG